MGTPETTLGGGAESFPETVWSAILSCPDARSPERRARLERLCTLYWRPVYRFIRAAWGKTIEDAKDLTQDFFARLLESDFISRYQPSQGRFRNFLKGALRNFLAEAHRDASRQKRGGGQAVVPLDIDDVEAGVLAPELGRYTPEQLYDREWADGLMADGLAQLKAQLVSEGKENYLKAFEAYDLCPPEQARPTYADLARSLGLSEHDVRNYLSFARARLRELIVRRISEYVVSPADVEEELRELSGLFGR